MDIVEGATRARQNFLAHHRESDGLEQTVKTHLQGVAKYSQKFASKIGLGLCGRLIGLVHDLGKYSQEFQSYLRSGVGLLNPDQDDYVDSAALKGKIDHSTAGAQIIWESLSSKDEVAALVGQILAICVASHHSGLIDCLTPDGTDNFKRRMQKEQSKTHLGEVLESADREIISEINALLSNPFLVKSCKEVLSTIFRRDRRSRIDPFHLPITTFKVGLLVRFLFSCLIDADRIDTANFENAKTASFRQNSLYYQWNFLAERLENHLSRFEVTNAVDEIRKEVSDICLSRGVDSRGIFTLTVPTGGGKTLASLRFALAHAEKNRLERIIYVIPYTSIIDQNAQVVRDILEKSEIDEFGSVVLEHHSNLTPEEQTWRAKILSENWDSPVVYTTSVQFLETLFGGGTRGARRMHQLAKALIVFDEIQTLPVRCVHIFCNAINYLVENCGSSVLLCTATQPLLGKLENKNLGFLDVSDKNEIIPDVKELFKKLKRVQVCDRTKIGGWSDDELRDFAINEAFSTGSCLMVVDTKAAAHNIYELCRSKGDCAVYHLSTSMCPVHRMKVLSEIKVKLGGAPLICISTQLIEAGVDIDFGTVIRFVAGMDSVVQASGRCNRNGKRRLGYTYIVNSAKDTMGVLRDLKIGKEQTERILSEFKKDPVSLGEDLLSPEVMNRYFTYYFYERSKDMSYQVRSDNGAVGRDDSILELLSTNRLTPVSFSATPYLRQSFKSAAAAFSVIDAPTQGVIVPFGDDGRKVIGDLFGAYDLDMRFRLLRLAQRYTVNVFPNILKQLKEQNAVSELEPGTGIWILNERFYSDEFGISIEAVSAPVFNVI